MNVRKMFWRTVVRAAARARSALRRWAVRHGGELKRGTSRYVVVFRRRGIALKFPRLRLRHACGTFLGFWAAEAPSRAKASFFRSWLQDGVEVMHSLRWQLLKGFADNWREFTFTLGNLGHPMVSPTYFSLFGAVSVVPVEAELPKGSSIWRHIINAIGMEVAGRDMHHLAENKNFCYGDDGYVRIRDYGSRVTQQILREHGHKLAHINRQLIEG